MAADQSLSDARLTDETLAELGLTEQPFIENKKFSRFSDSTTQKIRGELEQNLRFGKAISLFVGEDGVGKSVFLSQLLKHCKNNIKPFVAKGDDNFSSLAFLAAVSKQLGAEESDADTINDYIDDLVPQFENLSDGKLSVVLAVDDAHLAPIEEIAELMNLMTEFSDENGEQTARLLLTGDPELTDELAALADQLDESVEEPNVTTLLPLDETRVQDYLATRLKQAGHADAFPFTDKAITKISRESGGLPSTINTSAAGYLNKVYAPAAAGGGKGFLETLGWPLVALGTAAVGLIAWGLSMFFVDNNPDTVAVIETVPSINSTESTDNATLVVGSADSSSTQTGIQATTEQVVAVNDTLVIEDNAAPLADNNALNTNVTAATDAAGNSISDAVDTVTDSASSGATTVTDTVTTLVTGNQVTEPVQAGSTVAENAASEGSSLMETVNDTVTQRAEQISANTDTIIPESDLNGQNITVDSSTLITQETLAAPVDDQTAGEVVAITTQPTAQALPESVEVVVSGAASTVSNSPNPLINSDSDAASVNTEADNGGINIPVQPTLTDSNGNVMPAEGDSVQVVVQRAVENERWVLFQDAAKFTVQLATSKDRGKIIQLAQDIEAQDPVAIYPFLTTNSKNPVFGLLSGIYSSREEATAAVANMSEDATKYGFWIRPIGALQEDIKAGR